MGLVGCWMGLIVLIRLMSLMGVMSLFWCVIDGLWWVVMGVMGLWWVWYVPPTKLPTDVALCSVMGLMCSMWIRWEFDVNLMGSICVLMWFDVMCYINHLTHSLHIFYQWTEGPFGEHKQTNLIGWWVQLVECDWLMVSIAGMWLVDGFDCWNVIGWWVWVAEFHWVIGLVDLPGGFWLGDGLVCCIRDVKY